MKTYAVSLDLTVRAKDEKEAWAYANALGSHLGFECCSRDKECTDIRKYKDCTVECGNISEPDLLCEVCHEDIIPEAQEVMETQDGRTLCIQCYNKSETN